jgi:6-phosphogluconolactonase
MPNLHEHQLLNAQALAGQLAMAVAARLHDAIQAHGSAALAVSGGKSPIAFFECLREQDIDWHQVRITLVDDRCVPRDHGDSNALLVRTHLLQGLASAAAFVPLVDEAGPAVPTLDTLTDRARLQWTAVPRIDVMVLGMGDDGHTASLFPNAKALANGLDLGNSDRLIGVEPPVAPHLRISATLAEILAAEHIMVSLGGAAKQAVYQQALQGVQDALPISHVLHAQHPSTHVWMHA